MVRSIWRRTVLGVLASTGLAWGQQAVVPPAPVGDTVGRVITLSEMGKPGQKCKVLREWKMADGATARQVVNLTTGEKMTIVETGVLSGPMPGQPGGNIKSIASRIYHWGHSESSPMGVPMPPAESEAPAVAVIPPIQEKKTTEVVLPPVQNAAKTITPASPYAPSRPSAGEDKNTIVLPTPASPTVVQKQDPAKPTYTVPRPVWNQAATTMPASASPSTTVTQSTAQPAQPSDWRKSWGKLPERANADGTAKKSDSPSTAKTDATPKTKADPLTDPLPYTRIGAEEKINEKMSLPKLPDEKPAKAAKATSDSLPPLPPLAKVEPLPSLPTVKPTEPPAAVSVTTLPPLDKVEPLPTLPIVKPSEPQVATPVKTLPPPVATPPAPVVTLPAPVATPPAPVATRTTPRREKTATSAMPAPEPVGRVVVRNDTVSPAVASQANTQHLLHVLRDSVYPSERERAVDQLAECDWKQNTAVVDAMITAAKADPAATVRAGCVRCLVHMRANTAPVIQCVQSLKADADPRVRTEVQEALAILCPNLPIEPTPE